MGVALTISRDIASKKLRHPVCGQSGTTTPLPATSPQAADSMDYLLQNLRVRGMERPSVGITLEASGSRAARRRNVCCRNERHGPAGETIMRLPLISASVLAWIVVAATWICLADIASLQRFGALFYQ